MKDKPLPEPQAAPPSAAEFDRLRAKLDAATDTDGTPHADQLPTLPALFDALCGAALSDQGRDDTEFLERFLGLTDAVCLMLRGDGRLPFAPDVDLRPRLGVVAKRLGERPLRKFVKRLARGTPPVPGAKDDVRPKSEDRDEPPALESDWAKLAVARTARRPDADALTLAYAGAAPLLELTAFGRAVLSGRWGLVVRLDGRELVFTPDWECVCRFRDEAADYMELQWTGEEGVTVCRQLLLTRDDHQLIVADAVGTPSRPETTVEVESTLPLAAGVAAATVKPSRELRLDAAGLPARAFPVALPMLRATAAGGSFDAAPGGPTLRQAGRGGVYAAAVFDWHPRRREAFADWRPLTVTQAGRTVTTAQAAGCRLRVGGRQLLLYRSLDGGGTKRAVLGHHHTNETLFARFDKGTAAPLVLVE